MDWISWDQYFMMSAVLASKRSKDPVTKVGAVVVSSDNRILATGYNGFPNGISDSSLPWTKDSDNFEETKYAYVVHAEANCLLNSVKNDIKGCTMYVTLFCCHECTKLIIQKGIKKIVYANDPNMNKDTYRVSKKLFEMANIQTIKYNGPSEINLKI
jgi:dCMP deaminase